MEPTEQNIQKIVEDLSKNLYESCYVWCLETTEKHPNRQRAFGNTDCASLLTSLLRSILLAQFPGIECSADERI